MLLVNLGRFLSGMGGTLLFLLAFQTISFALADLVDPEPVSPNPFCGNAATCDDGCYATGIKNGTPGVLCGVPMKNNAPHWGGTIAIIGCYNNGFGHCYQGCDCIERGTFPQNVCSCDT